MRAALLALLVAVASLAGPVAAYHDYDESSDGSVTVLRGPPDAATLADARAVRDARENGTLRAANRTTDGETLVVAFRSRALNDTYAAADGPNATARFFGALEEVGGNVTVQRVDHGTAQPAMYVDPRGPGVRAVRDRANATFYLLFDTDALALETDGGDPLRRDLLAPGELGVTVEVPTDDAGDAANDDDRRRLTSLVTIRDPESDLTGASAGVALGRPLYADPGAADLDLRARTTLLPGEPVTVRLHHAGTVVAERRVETVPRATDSWLNATLPLDVARGERVRVTARWGNHTVLDRAAVVGRPPTLSNVSLAYVPHGEHARQTRVRATVRFPSDGFLVVERSNPYRRIGRTAVAAGAAGERRRVTFYTDAGALDIGDGVTVEAVWDRDGNGQFDPDGDPVWFARGEVVRVEDTLQRYANGTRATASPTRTRTPTPTFTPLPPITSSPTATATPTATPTDSPAPPPPGTTAASTGTTQPGYGVPALAAALVALAVLLARR